MNYILVILLSILVPRDKEVDYASIFAMKHDKWAGGASICLMRRVLPSDHIIAHRTLPCGTMVFIYNQRTKLSTIAFVGDHGPYGACLDNDWEKGTVCHHWTLKKHEYEPGIWRGSFDLTPAVANDIGHQGIEPVEVTIIKSIPPVHFLAKNTRPTS